MQTTATPTTSQPLPKRRGRPPGAKDAQPRKRRSKSETAKEPKPAKPKKVREGDMQAQCMKWLDTIPAPEHGGRVGDYAYAVPNGIWLPGANLQQRIRVIMTMRRQGMKKGVLDVTIALPLHGRPGCMIELKRYQVGNWSGDNRSQMKPEQIEWAERLRRAGYFVEIAVGVPGFCAAVGRYLRGEDPEPFPWDTVITADDLHSEAS